MMILTAIGKAFLASVLWLMVLAVYSLPYYPSSQQRRRREDTTRTLQGLHYADLEDTVSGQWADANEIQRHVARKRPPLYPYGSFRN